jgi:hypothetical protein
MPNLDIRAYERYVMDGAARASALEKNNLAGWARGLCRLNGIEITDVIVDHIARAVDARHHPEYSEVRFRGYMCDEAVYEHIKEVLRIVYADKIYPTAKG